MIVKWMNFLIPLALLLFYGYKTYYKKQKSLEHGFLLGVMFILAVFALSKLFSFYMRPSL